MNTITAIVVAGGGLAAAKAVETVRAEGFTGRVTLVSDEAVRPYERPALSKARLVGEDTNVFVHNDAFYDDHDIDLRLGTTVRAIDRAQSVVITGAGEIPFDRLLIATGAAPRELPGVPAGGVYTLRTMADSAQIHDAITAARHVLIVGAGWIGCEVAAAARRLGASVTMIDPLDVPLQRVLGTEVGSTFTALHRRAGVDLRLGVGLSSLRGDDHVEAAVLTDGSLVETDCVIVGIGVMPRDGLAEQAGLGVANGILTDATLQTTEARIFAAGDVARAEHPLYGPLRVEHWANALNQGVTAGRNLLGAGEIYDRLPYFYSDQYDVGMEYVGHAVQWDEVVVRGHVSRHEFVAFWLQNNRVIAAMHCNTWGVIDDLKALISARVPVAPESLRDNAVDLGDLVAAVATS